MPSVQTEVPSLRKETATWHLSREPDLSRTYALICMKVPGTISASYSRWPTPRSQSASSGVVEAARSSTTRFHHAIDVSRHYGWKRLIIRTATADTANVRFYQRLGFRCIGIEPGAFTPTGGYPPDLMIDGIPLRDAIVLDLSLTDGSGFPAPILRPPLQVRVPAKPATWRPWLPSAATGWDYRRSGGSLITQATTAYCWTCRARAPIWSSPLRRTCRLQRRMSRTFSSSIWVAGRQSKMCLPGSTSRQYLVPIPGGIGLVSRFLTPTAFA